MQALSPRPQRVVRESKILVIPKISDFRTTPQSAHADKERSREGIQRPQKSPISGVRTRRFASRQRRLRFTFTLCRAFTTLPVEDWTCDGSYSSSRLRARQERRSRRITPSPPSRSGTLRIHACGDCAPCADCRRKPTVREKACRGTRKPHPQRACQREQGGVVHMRGFFKLAPSNSS